MATLAELNKQEREVKVEISKLRRDLREEKISKKEFDKSFEEKSEILEDINQKKADLIGLPPLPPKPRDRIRGSGIEFPEKREGHFGLDAIKKSILGESREEPKEESREPEPDLEDELVRTDKKPEMPEPPKPPERKGEEKTREEDKKEKPEKLPEPPKLPKREELKPLKHVDKESLIIKTGEPPGPPEPKKKKTSKQEKPPKPKETKPHKDERKPQKVKETRIIKEKVKKVPVEKETVREVPVVTEKVKKVPVVKEVPVVSEKVREVKVPVVTEKVKKVPVVKRVEVPVIKERIKEVPVIKEVVREVKVPVIKEKKVPVIKKVKVPAGDPEMAKKIEQSIKSLNELKVDMATKSQEMVQVTKAMEDLKKRVTGVEDLRSDVKALSMRVDKMDFQGLSQDIYNQFNTLKAFLEETIRNNKPAKPDPELAKKVEENSQDLRDLHNDFSRIEKENQDFLREARESMKKFQELEGMKGEIEELDARIKNIDFEGLTQEIYNQFQKMDSDINESEVKISDFIEKMKVDIKTLESKISDASSAKEHVDNLDITNIRRDMESLKQKSQHIENHIQKVDLEPVIQMIQDVENKVNTLSASSALIIE